jgi:hypothetical protein
MAKLTRKELIKGGAVGAATLAALPLGGSIAFASKGEAVAVHVHLRSRAVNNVGADAGSIDLNVDAAGREDALSGAGWDTNDADTPNPFNNCYFTQRGTLEGDDIQLHGAVLFTNTLAFVGARITTKANLKTGDITWIFVTTPPIPGSPFTVTGQGVVTKVG